MFSVTLASPWIIVGFDRPMDCLGWTPQGGGATRATTVLWREVRNEDLTESFDVLPWLAQETAKLGQADAPCFLTSRQVASYVAAEACVEGILARAVVTAGLGNAERIGLRRGPDEPFGTINLLLAVNQTLSFPARLEALSLLAEARTTAMLDHAPRLWQPVPTGTGTDCLCLASLPDTDLTGEDARLSVGTAYLPATRGPAPYAGKHTALGEAIGRAAYDAFAQAISAWQPPR